MNMHLGVSKEAHEYLGTLSMEDLLVLRRALEEGDPEDLLSVEQIKELIETYRDKN